MSRKSRDKGSAFERLVAAMVLEAIPGFTKKDCYRTPLSGGHPVADSGDLVVSERLQKKFPFVVECKHVKDWNLQWLWPPNSAVRSWITQAQAAAKRMGTRRPWLLVMRGNNTPVYCLYEMQSKFNLPAPSELGPSHMVLCSNDECLLPYVVVRFDAFLQWRWKCFRRKVRDETGRA